MKRRQQILAYHTADYKIWMRIITEKVSLRLFAILFIACWGIALVQTTAAQQYQVTYLDSLGGTNSRGNSINNRGWIAGYSRLSGDQNRHATLWRDGSLLDLGTLAGPDRNSSVVWPVKNDRGIIVGISQTDTLMPLGERWSSFAFYSGPNRARFSTHGFVWENEVMRDLPPLPGGNNSFATGADNTGQVVGWAENDVHDSACVAPQVLQFRPVIWGPGTDQIRTLPLIADDSSGAATAINNRGQIVGISGICDQAVGRYTAKHAVLWDNGEMINLGNLGAELWITPMSINQQGDIVGFGATRSDDLNGDFLRAFIWTRKAGIKQLDPLPLSDHVFSQANAINESGQVAGISCTVEGDCLAVVWENGVLKNLNDFIAPGFNGVLLNAQDINDQGEIVGRAFDPATGELRAYKAVPVSAAGNATGKQATSSLTRTKIVLPETVKQTLRQQRGLMNARLLQ